MRVLPILSALACLAAGEAWAQVPVTDAARESAERGIAKCMTTANASRFATVSPSQGTKGSVVAPGGANGAATSAVGGADLTGGAGFGMSNAGANAGASTSSAVSSTGSSASYVGQGTGAGVSSASISTIGGVNLSGLTGSSGASVNIGNALQIFKAVSSVTTALQTNSSALTTAGGLIGSINAAQGGWDQNSGGRIAQTANWNQVAQTVMTSAQLRNQILIARILAASAAAAAMKPN